MMKKEILYVTAFNELGILVKANDVQKNEKYFCPICKNELILKKSGNIGKGSRRPHFAHYTLSENCTPESVLHYSFKKMLLEYIQNNINTKLPINIIWKCNYCNIRLPVNLLTNNCDVKDEYDMKICRPDIALLDDKGEVYVVFEIVVTHKPEDNAINYYKSKNILLILIELNSEDALENISETLTNHSIIKIIPDYFKFCINPNCISRRRNLNINPKRSRRF